MGASKSKETGKCRTRISDEEMSRLRSTFGKFVREKTDLINEAKLEEHFNKLLSPNTTSQLCELLAVTSKKVSSDNHSKNHSQKYSAPITFSGLLAFIDEFLIGNDSVHCEIITRLAANQRDMVTAKEMLQFLSDLNKAYFAVISHTVTYKSWEAGVAKADSSLVAQTLLNELFFKGKMPKDCTSLEAIPDARYSVNDVEHWHRHSPTASKIITTVFRMAFTLDTNEFSEREGDRYRQLLPLCSGVSWQKTNSILSLPDILFLNQCLPASLNSQWRYVFSTKQYGESFSQLLGKILNKGPTLLVIRDKAGGIFGGFASDSWKLQPQFGGTESCFLFTLRPRLGVFPSTGYNDHYMYLNINQQTMPNGLGMGGQLEYFGLWLDRDFGKGTCSKTCTTYENPQLSSSLEFSLDTVEVWAVGPEPKTEEEGTRSALDTLDPELKAILEMTNRAPISDAIREADSKIFLVDSDNDE